MSDALWSKTSEDLQLTLDGGADLHEQVLDAQLELSRAPARETPLGEEVAGLGEEVLEAALELELTQAAALPAGGVGEENLYAVAERLAARAASPATRRQYSSIYRAFGDWLRGELGRPPVLGDVDADVIAAYARHLETKGGRGGGPAAPATRRIYLSMVRALARQAGLDAVADEVRIPRHVPGPPETLTDTDYQNLLRVPDRRSQIGKRDYALLRALGDLGLRSAELRGIRRADLRRPRSNARHQQLYVRGKGGREREVPVPEETQHAIDAWLSVHPLARGRGLRDEEPVFVRLGRHRGTQEPKPLSAQAVGKLVRAAAAAAGVPERLGHPHALRSYAATTLLEDGVAPHVVQDWLGHADLRTTSRYAAVRPAARVELVDVLDRRHHDARRRRG